MAAKNTEPEVVQALRRQMDELGAAIARVDEATASVRPAEGVWSVKEQLSHLYGADGDTFLDRVRVFFEEAEPEVDVEPGITHFDASRKAMPLDELLARVQAQYRGIADLMAQASEEDLARRGHIELLARTPFGNRPTLEQWVDVISSMHLAGHLAELQKQ
jgi:DinB superfamily